MRFVLLTLLPLTLLSCGCVARNNYGTGYGYGGGYGATAQSGAYAGYPSGTTYQPPYSQPNPYTQPVPQAGYNPYAQPVFAPQGQTILPPATGTLGPGSGYYQAPGQSYAPAYSPATGTSTGSNAWQPVAAPNTGAQNLRTPRPAAMPRNLRLATNLAWGTSSGSVSQASYNSPVVSSTQFYSAPVSALAPVDDCGCNGTSTANATYLAPVPR